MMQILTYVILFFVLFVGFLWLFISLFNETRYTKRVLTRFPKVTICVPAYNEEKTISGTLSSILASDYPSDKMEIIVCDDGSTDATQKKVQEFMKKNKSILLLSQKQKGKAAALNMGLQKATGEFFSVVDADSKISKQALSQIVAEFEHASDDVASIISPIKIANTSRFFARVQKIEYSVAAWVRQMMSDIDTLHLNHGVLCLNKTNVLRQIGGYDEKNLTEDFELAFRMRYHGHRVVACKHSVVYTNAPATLGAFWRQRVRWFRGYIQTHRKFKSMAGKKKFGQFGVFQMPLNILTPFFILLACSVLVYSALQNTYHLLFRLLFVEGYLRSVLESLPTIPQFFLTINAQVFVPMVLAVGIALLILLLSVRFISNSFKNPLDLLVYLFIFPLLAMLQWALAFWLELRGAKNKW